MAAATVTTTVALSHLTDLGYRARGTMTINASPATYTTGGIACNLNQSDIKASRAPLYVTTLSGATGYVYQYIRGTDNSNGLLIVRQQDGSTGPLAELGSGASIPAAVSGDIIHWEGTWKGML